MVSQVPKPGTWGTHQSLTPPNPLSPRTLDGSSVVSVIYCMYFAASYACERSYPQDPLRKGLRGFRGEFSVSPDCAKPGAEHRDVKGCFYCPITREMNMQKGHEEFCKTFQRLTRAPGFRALDRIWARRKQLRLQKIENLPGRACGSIAARPEQNFQGHVVEFRFCGSSL